MRFTQRFAQRSVSGALIRASIAWVLITPAVAAAQIWWSTTAAVIVAVVGVAAYIGLAFLIIRGVGRG